MYDLFDDGCNTLSIIKHLKTKLFTDGGPWSKIIQNRSLESNLIDFLDVIVFKCHACWLTSPNLQQYKLLNIPDDVLLLSVNSTFKLKGIIHAISQLKMHIKSNPPSIFSHPKGDMCKMIPVQSSGQRCAPHEWSAKIYPGDLHCQSVTIHICSPVLSSVGQYCLLVHIDSIQTLVRRTYTMGTFVLLCNPWLQGGPIYK